MEKFNPKVSIIIPVYNGSNYIKEAIDSALAQTYRNLEVIVVDDGSIDNTEKICKKYGDKIRYYKKENGGVSTALNLGISVMEGEYFSWLSHDDLYYKNKIQKQIKILSTLKNKNTVIFGDYELINEKGIHQYNVVLKHDELIKHPYKSLCLGCLNGITMLIPKNAFEKCGEFNKEFRCTQDYDMYKRLIKEFPFYHITDILTKTRLHELQDSNMSPKALIEGNVLWESILFETEDKYIKQNFVNKENFYSEMYDFLKYTPFDLAIVKCKKKLLEIRKINDDIYLKVPNILIIINNKNNCDLLLNSIISQTYKNYKIVFTDNISKYQKTKLKKHNIDYDITKNPYSYIYHSKEDYICYLKSSTCQFQPNKLIKQVEFMHTNNLQCSFTNFYNLDYEISIKTDGLYSNYDKLKKLNFNTIMIFRKYALKYDIISMIESDIIVEKIKLLKECKYDILREDLAFDRGLMINYYSSDKKYYIELLKDIINAKNYSIEDVESLIFDLQCCIDYNDNGYNPYEELKKIYNSRSWSYTKPFRNRKIFQVIGGNKK